MTYNELISYEKSYLNGKVSVFIDNYIRTHKVWTPQQLTDDFIVQIKNELGNDKFIHTYVDPKRPNLNFAKCLKWAIGTEGEKWVLSKSEKKYEKDADIAKRDRPIAERIRFGDKRSKQYFDVNFGLKGSSGHDRMTTEELRKVNHKPWTIVHIDSELNNKYGTKLDEVISSLPMSAAETIFYKHWLENFYNNSANPGLIPQINTFRSGFYYYIYKGDIYNNYQDLDLPIHSDGVESIAYHFDFAIINFSKQLAVLIDVEDFETKEELAIREIRKRAAKEEGFDYLDISPSEITKDIQGVFDKIDNYLKD